MKWRDHLSNRLAENKIHHSSSNPFACVKHKCALHTSATRLFVQSHICFRCVQIDDGGSVCSCAAVQHVHHATPSNTSQQEQGSPVLLIFPERGGYLRLRRKTHFRQPHDNPTAAMGPQHDIAGIEKCASVRSSRRVPQPTHAPTHPPPSPRERMANADDVRLLRGVR